MSHYRGMPEPDGRPKFRVLPEGARCGNCGRFRECYPDQSETPGCFEWGSGQPAAPPPIAERRCAVCGCTEEHACPGGCYWVLPNLCSQCAAKAALALFATGGPAPAAEGVPCPHCGEGIGLVAECPWCGEAVALVYPALVRSEAINGVHRA